MSLTPKGYIFNDNVPKGATMIDNMYSTSKVFISDYTVPRYKKDLPWFKVYQITAD